MKILYHHRTQAKGVEGVHIWGVIKNLKELGHQVYVVSLVNDSNVETQVSSKEKAPSKYRFSSLFREFLHVFANHAPNFIFRLSELFYNLIALSKLIKTLNSQDIDIIYERYAYFNFSGVLASKLYKKPLILEVNIFTGLNDARSLALQPIAKAIEKRVFKSCDAIFVISDYLKSEMIRAYALNEGKIHVQPNAIDPDQLINDVAQDAPCIESINPESVTIGFLGRLLPWYKLHELATVFASIQNRCPQTQLVFIGDGPERVNLENELRKSNVLKNVIFCGSVTHAQALTLLRKCDIGVIPSTNMWGSPMKLFEYMGSGLPVVAPNIGVISSIMADSIHGRLFEYDNFNDFEESLLFLIKNEDLRVTMGKQAKKHVIENHSWKKVSEHVIDVAEDILLKKRQ